LDSRAFIAIIISLVTIFAYEEFVLKRLYPPAGRQPAAQPSTSLRAVPTPAQPSVQPPAALTAGIAAGVPAAALRAGIGPGRQVEIETPLFHAVLSGLGARLTSFELTHYRASAGSASPPLNLVRHGRGEPYPLGLALKQEGAVSDDGALDYHTGAPPRTVLEPGQSAVVTFTATTASGFALTKTMVFSADNYAFELKARVDGDLAKLKAFGLELGAELGALEGYRNVLTLEAEVNGKTLSEEQSNLAGGVAPVSGTVAYAGFGDRYFLSALLPRRPSQATLEMGLDGSQGVALLWFPVGAGTQAEADLTAYLGPKKLDHLEAVNPRLRDSINFGWAAIIAVPFVHALNFFYRFAPNYGVDIILLTITIRLLLLPISLRSQRSMIKMQRLAPQVERLREKHKDDQQRLNREMMDLYRRNHVSPLGGCLPTLVQLPIFIGLYEALLNAVELRHAPFIWWIHDLSAPECLTVPHMPELPFTTCGGIPVLVLLMGLSAFVQQKMSPQPVDPSQQRMMTWMPLAFTLLFLNFPSGLTLYYFFTNLLGVIQQYVLNREFKQAAPVAT
jgi:YidC/Oxa1 family membrane protein insertase